MSLTVFSLFAGIGGLELGLERAGMTTVGQVEIDPFCRRVLAKHWPHVPRHDDVRTAAEWWLSKERPAVDVICGGFPCQDISAAGKRAGIIDGERSNLWAYLADTVRVLRPRYVLLENVARIVTRDKSGVIAAEIVAADLAAIGYDLRWDCVPASALGAHHERDRWFGIAYPQGGCRSDEQVGSHTGWLPVGAVAGSSSRANGWGAAEGDRQSGRGASLMEASVADTASVGRGQGRAGRPAGHGSHWSTVWPRPLAHPDREPLVRPAIPWDERDPWRTEPDVGRVVDGLSGRLDRDRHRARIRALGNTVVPQVAEHVGRLIVAHNNAARVVA